MAIVPKRLYELSTYLPEVDLTTPQSELIFMIDHPSWTEPRQFPFDMATTFPDWSDALKADLLALLEVPDVVSVATLATAMEGLVPIEEGYDLISVGEIERLANVRQNVYTITLPASTDVSGRITGAAMPEGTTGWSISASGANLVITHTLDSEIAWVSVKELSSPKRIATPFEDAYAGISEGDGTVTIEGLDTEDVGLQINLIFN